MLYSAFICESLALQCGLDERSAYTAGLMRPLGMLVVDRLADGYRKVDPYHPAQDKDYMAWEGRIFGLSSPEVAGMVLGEWKFPAVIVEGVRNQYLVRSDDLTFLLTSGGHNAGIVSGPVHPKRHHRIKTRRLPDPHLAPEDWMAAATLHEGSWWPAWQRWLAAHSSAKVKPPAMGAARKGYRVLEDAPGHYVRQR